MTLIFFQFCDNNNVLCYSLDNGVTKFYDMVQMIDFYTLNQGVLVTNLTFFLEPEDLDSVDIDLDDLDHHSRNFDEDSHDSNDCQEGSFDLDFNKSETESSLNQKISPEMDLYPEEQQEEEIDRANDQSEDENNDNLADQDSGYLDDRETSNK